MKIEVATDVSVFHTLAKEWHQLLTHAQTNHLFMTPEFQSSWWKNLGEGELQIISFREDSGELVGIAPLFLSENEDGKKQLSFVGCVNVSDYLDFVIDRGRSTEVYSELLHFLQQSSVWEKMRLCSIPQISPTLTTFQQQLRQKGFKAEQKQQDVCPVISLPQTWDEYLAMIGKKQRHEIKRKWEKLFREVPAEFELLEKPADIKTSIKDFIQLHQQSSEDKKNFWDEQHIRFFEDFAIETAEEGWLKLYFLKIKGVRVASMFGFDYNQQFFLYNSGFAADEYGHLSVGNVLTSYTIQQAIMRGNQRYDFLRGDEEYKFRYRAVAEPVFDLDITR